METENSLRLLTLGEKNLAQVVFGSSIQWNKVWVHCESYLPFGLQGNFVGMTPNGEMYFRKETYLKDFSLTSKSNQHFFMHEMTHVWQHQHGMWVRTRGVFSWVSTYKYTIDPGKYLNKYNMEQQAQVIADYFLLKKYGVSGLESEIGRQAGFQGVLDNNTISLYRKILPASIL
ncbi:type IV secretion protein Rhs [Pantoea agglomerans]|uniref:type IV secretion protein Rhs n=1 Tax=Enterobacter agglomerans TaxID=549 RepID=UPI00177E93D7|nr:type IV secretion protein Rhs [Pantoea agglomerans]MBD8130977.1 type IV secretion protein Rhs [Pantoea agglomerans]